MAIPITIPRLGWTMDHGVFVGWLKSDGDAVTSGQTLFSLESDKSTEDIECLDAGVLRFDPNLPRPGDTVAVGSVIGYLVEPGESIPFSREPPASAANIPGNETYAAKIAISPRARRIARELAIDPTKLQGTGRTGRIRERDVRAAARRTAPSASLEIAITPSRQIIADRMLASHQSTAPVTLTTTVDATNLVNLRGQFKASAQAGHDGLPSYTDFLVKLVASALQKHPRLNASWTEDRIVEAASINIGIAVDTAAGLLVPVVHDVPGLTLKQLCGRSRDLIERARGRKLKADDMRGATFTVTNLGAYGVDAFTPIINQPQCAILGIGRIQRQPVAVGDQVAVREQVTLSLTFDHRIVDGAPAARFLQTLSVLIENPGPWLMT